MTEYKWHGSIQSQCRIHRGFESTTDFGIGNTRLGATCGVQRRVVDGSALGSIVADVMTTVIIITDIITQRRMTTARTTYSTYLLPAHSLPLLQHFEHTFPLPPPPPTMEEEQGVNQVAYTTDINNNHSILPSRR